MKADGPQDSPDRLGFRPQPEEVVRVSRKPIAIALFALTAVVLAIMAGVVTRKPAASLQQARRGGEISLEPALTAGEQVTRHIPEGNLPERQAWLARQAPSPLQAPGVIETPAATPGSLSGSASPPPLLPATGPSQHTVQGASPVDPALERARRLQEEREARLRQAMEAGTTPQSPGAAGSGFAATGGIPAQNTPLTVLQQLQAAALRAATASPAASALSPREEDDQNRQARKEQFLRDMQETPPRHVVNGTRTAALSSYEIKAGWNIPATMQHGINSDLPGSLTALVSQNVFDTATGRHLLIPQGATLVGTYDSQVAYGQNGLLVVWRRIVFPDASSLDLEGMGAADAGGYGGFRDQVNNHYGRIVGFGLLTSLFSAAFQISQNEKQAVTGAPTPSQTAGAAVAQQMSQLGIEIARKNLRVQPTIEIRPGYPFQVRVEKDLVFARPYQYGNAP